MELMQQSTPIRRLDTIDGRGFVEIRAALRALSGIQPQAKPDQVRLISGPAGTVAVFREGDSITGMRVASGTPVPVPEVRYLMANADPAQPPRSVRSANVPLIERAAIEFAARKRFDLDEYVFTVVDDGPMRVVLLQNGPRTSYEVGFDRETFEKLKSHYSR